MSEGVLPASRRNEWRRAASVTTSPNRAIQVFWDLTLWLWAMSSRHFGESWWPYLQKTLQTAWHWGWRHKDPSKPLNMFTILDSIKTQKNWLLRNVAAINWNPAQSNTTRVCSFTEHRKWLREYVYNCTELFSPKTQTDSCEEKEKPRFYTHTHTHTHTHTNTHTHTHTLINIVNDGLWNAKLP